MFDKMFTVYDGEKHYELLDFAKGFSITTIVIMHLIQCYTDWPGIVKTAASLGGTGVHVFFFCSGFGLCQSWERKPEKYVDFIKKRMAKIYIPYIVVIFISFFVPLMYKADDRVQALLSHVFLYKMFIPRYDESFGAQMWYISTLFQFYFLFPLIIRIFKKVSTNKFFCLCFGLSFAWWILTGCTNLYTERVWASFFLQYLWEFALGIIVASHLNSKGKLGIRIMHLWICLSLGIGLQALLALSGSALRQYNDVPGFVGYTSAILLLYSLNLKLVNRVLLFVNSFSYEWYLTHLLVFALVNWWLVQYTSQNISAFVCLVVSMFIAYLYKCIIHRFRLSFIRR